MNQSNAKKIKKSHDVDSLQSFGTESSFHSMDDGVFQHFKVFYAQSKQLGGPFVKDNSDPGVVIAYNNQQQKQNKNESSAITIILYLSVVI